MNSLHVVKLSGKVTGDAVSLAHLAADISLLARSGEQVVVVHGGGKQLDDFAASLGLNQPTVDGRRVTDTETLELAKMIYAGKINTNITAALVGAGVSAVGISGVAAGIIQARRRAPVPVDFGHVGDIVKVDASLIKTLLADGRVPVIACLGVTHAGDVLNINADTIAAAIAIALKASKTSMVSDVDGIYADPKDPASRLAHLDLAGAQEMLASGNATGGMRPKLKAVIEQIEGGVGAVHVISGQTSLLSSRTLPGTSGTTIARHL